MFMFLVFSVIRYALLPISVILMLQTQFGLPMAYTAVFVVFTVLNIPHLLWSIVKLIPNLALLRTKAVLRTFLTIIFILASTGVMGYFFLQEILPQLSNM